MLTTGAHAQPITGAAKVIDGDTIEINLQRIRFYGVDALELKQTCTDTNPVVSMSKTNTWHGGKYAAGHLSSIIVNPVTCTPQGRSYNRVVAICRGKDGTDLAQAMVLAGYAVADTNYSVKYLDDTRRARIAQVGMHTQDRHCSTPWSYRQKEKTTSPTPTPLQ